MPLIDDFFKKDVAQFIIRNVNKLPNRARYRARNSLRNLDWASKNNTCGMPKPASFLAMHATEEAVASFVGCAKACRYLEVEKIRCDDHAHKMAVSTIAQAVGSIFEEYHLKLCVPKNSDIMLSEYTLDGANIQGIASFGSFHFLNEDGFSADNFYEQVIKYYESEGGLIKLVRRNKRIRNDIFYATSSGMPKFSTDVNSLLQREKQISFGLIWGAIDMFSHNNTRLPFYQQAINTAAQVIEELAQTGEQS